MSMELVHSEQKGGCVIVRIGNPPVNALSSSTREQLLDAINSGKARSDIHSIILTSSIDVFSAGADVSEFSGSFHGINIRLD